jgi:hypothetical protein
MPAFSFTVTEHDPARPWIVVGSERRSVELDEGRSVYEWAAAMFPRSRFTVELDPFQPAEERSMDPDRSACPGSRIAPRELPARGLQP